MKGIARTVMCALALGIASDVRMSAANISAASCNSVDVQSAFDRARAGDTVFIPAGTCVWTNRVILNAPPNLTVLGAGSLTTLGGGDATVIVDNYVSSNALLPITTAAEGSFRLAGLTVRGGTGSIKENGVISVGGLSKAIRIDHMHIDMQSYATHTAAKPLTLSMWITGVIDHIIIDHARQGHIHFSASWYGTGAENFGDASFAAPTGFGSSDFVFVEDSLFRAREDRNEAGVFIGTITDCNAGGRFVLRYNRVEGASFAQTHPTGGAGRGRGCRAHEVYGNTAVPSPDFDPNADQPPFTFSWMSSGTSLVWGNSSNGVHKNFLYMDSMRKNNATYTQYPTDWGYCGSTFTGALSPWDGNLDASGYPCLDQPGRGRSDLLAGMFPNAYNTKTNTRSWPSQMLEPVREWLNTFTAVRGWGNDGSGRLGVAGGVDSRLTENRDFYGFNPSFDGRTGVGAGPRSARPATCTPGVAYWSTDSGGDWNGVNGTANDGTLDVCASANTWSNGAYTPYSYPHPLTSGGSSQSSVPTGPPPPSNVRVVS